MLLAQLAAVQQNGKAIQYIENPSEDAQLAAVQENGRNFGSCFEIRLFKK